MSLCLVVYTQDYLVFFLLVIMNNKYVKKIRIIYVHDDDELQDAQQYIQI